MVRAEAIMTASVFAVKRDTDIYQAIRTMVEQEITGLPVVADDQTLVGVVSEKDVLSLLYNNEDHPGTVENFMTRDVVTFEQDADIVDVAERLQTNDFRRIPILKDGKLVGIISRKDIIRHIKEQGLGGKLSEVSRHSDLGEGQ